MKLTLLNPEEGIFERMRALFSLRNIGDEGQLKHCAVVFIRFSTIEA
ncbi:MAG: hypothetical protein QF707_08120 [Candidatus Poseidoniaceae archaeon]|nr:hypothetical protein [Candidatus Poseidoniaceae archaeon]